MAKKQLSLSDVKEQFGAWQVPSEAHFEALINIAALSLKVGAGLSGGAPSPDAARIDIGKVTPLTVNAYYGVEAKAEGLFAKPDPFGGLKVDTQGLKVKASDSVGFDGNGVFLRVNESKALKVEGGNIAVKINDKAGFKKKVSTGMSLSVDSKTVEIDANGALRLKCAPTGGLTVDQDGHLGVDLDIILRRPCIRAYQGSAYAYIPKNMIGEGDKVFLYIHDVYVGEFYHTGAVAGDSRIKMIVGSEATEYWIALLNVWVTENDVLRARLIKKGQDEAAGTDIACHTVTPAGAAPATIPRITEVQIVNSSGQPLTEVKAGDIIHAQSGTDANNLTHRWMVMNATAKAWNILEDHNQAEFKVPDNAASGDQFCVFLSYKDNKASFAFSSPVTVITNNAYMME